MNEKVTVTAADGVSLVQVDEEALAQLEREVLGPDGRQTPQPASVYAKHDITTRVGLCVKHGIYGLVTHELVEFIREQIAGRTAIEIGSGDGVLAAALGIPATDSRMQERADVRSTYEKLMQTPVRYGTQVEHLDGAQAVIKYRPQVIVASWLTHRWHPDEPTLGGNMYAPDELMLLANCQTLIFVGNSGAHSRHRLLRKTHLYWEFDWLYSRAWRGKNFIGVWKGGRK